MATFRAKVGLYKRYEDQPKATFADQTGIFGEPYLSYNPKTGTTVQLLNDTGYGSDTGVILSDHARLLLVRYLGGDQPIILPEAYNASSPTVEEFTIPLEYDGVYELSLLLVPLDRGQAFATGQARFLYDQTIQPYLGEVEVRQANGAWVKKPIEELFGFVSSNTHLSEVLYEPLFPEAERLFQQVETRRIESRLGQRDQRTTTLDDISDDYNLYFTAVLNAAEAKLPREIQRISEGMIQLNEQVKGTL